MTIKIIKIIIITQTIKNKIPSYTSIERFSLVFFLSVISLSIVTFLGFIN